MLLASCSSRRWIVLFSFCALSLSNNVQWITYATVVDEAKEFFNCDAFQINSLAWVYSAVYVVLGLPLCAVYDRFGLRNGMLIGGALNAAGALLKFSAVYVSPNYTTLLLAQVVNSAAQCFTLGLPPMVAAAWFGTKERSLATSLASVANVLGVAIGFPLPPMIVSSGPDRLKEQFGELFGIEAAMCGVALLCVMLFVADGPSDAPAVTSRRRADPVPLMATLKALCSNGTFVLLAVTMGLSNGMFGGLATILTQVNSPFGISGNQTGWIGCVGALFSILGSVFIGKIIDSIRQYKLPLLLLNLMNTVCIAALIISYSTDSSPLVNAFFWLSLLQILQAMGFTVVFEYSVEVTYPIPEALSGTALMVLPNLINMCICITSSSLLGNNPEPSDSLNSLAICCAVAGASGAACLFVDEQLRRVQVELLSSHVADDDQ